MKKEHQLNKKFKTNRKKDLQDAVKFGKKQIKNWTRFLRLTEKELEKFKKVPKKYRLNLPTSRWTE